MNAQLVAVAIGVFVLVGLMWGVFVVRDLFRIRRQRRASETAAPAQAAAATSAPRATERPNAARLPYVRTPQLLTPAEQTFFTVLQSVVPPGFVVYPQMRLASIVHVETWARTNYTHFNRIQAKCVDFVLCETQTTAPRLVVELDDSSHNRRDRKERDAFVDQVLASAGVPILHVRWQRAYDAPHLARNVQTLLGIALPPAISAPRLPTASEAPALVALAVPPASPESTSATRYACAQCQRAVTRAAKHCPHCGTLLS